MHGPRLLVAGGVAALAIAGCGNGDDRAQVRAATNRFSQAVQRHDGTTACAQLSPDLRQQLVKDEPGKTCARAVLELSLHGGTTSAVHVYATSAQAELTGGDTVFLSETDQGWRLEALGCHPDGGGPFQCQEESG